MTFPQPHPSLPARPQVAATARAFKPAFSAEPTSTSNGAPGTKSHYGGESTASPATGGFTGFKPRTVGNSHYSSTSISAAPAPPSNFSAASAYPTSGYQQQPAQYQPQYPYQQQSYYSAPTEAESPQIRNPFPLPGQAGYGQNGSDRTGNVNYDPEYEAQIAQWQSAYAARDDTAGSKGAQGYGSTAGPTVSVARGPIGNASQDAVAKPEGVAGAATNPDGKQKTVVRSGGGETWQDSSLLEWDPAHFRLFVGNLAGEVTDESLLKAFSKYESVQKARVIRDKRTTKSKGFGFVSFSDGDQFFKAAKEMQGKYIGSHPVILRRSTTEIKPVIPTDKNKKGKGDKGGNAGGHANTGAGVQKKQAKTKGGLKILG